MVAGKDVASITVTTLSKNQRPIEITLNDTIWHTSLLRGPWKDEFQSLWEMSKSLVHRKTEALNQLKQIPNFEAMSKNFIRDLRCFGEDTAAQTRLNNTNHDFFSWAAILRAGNSPKDSSIAVRNVNFAR